MNEVDLKTFQYRNEAYQLMQDIDQPAARSIGRSLLKNASDLPTEADFYMNGPICRVCGNLLHSGENGCKVRVKGTRSSRTMRRRASREKRATLQREARLKQRGVQIRKNIMSKIEGRPITCANVLVFTCGNCGRNEKFAGCISKHSNVSKNSNNNNNDRSRSNSPMPSTKNREAFSFTGSNKPVAEKPLKSKERDAKVLSLSSDFIALPQDAKTTTLLHQTRKRKKKKNSEDTKKSKLMSFLSSLND